MTGKDEYKNFKEDEIECWRKNESGFTQILKCHLAKLLKIIETKAEMEVCHSKLWSEG